MQNNHQFNVSFTNKNDKNEGANNLIALIPNYKIELISTKLFFLIDVMLQKSILLEQSLLPLIDSLKTFKTASEHVNQFIDETGFPVEMKSKVLLILENLQKQGLAVTPDIYLDFSKSEVKHCLLTTPPKVVVRTSGRVGMLKRFLKSAAENEANFNAAYQYIIIDDSTPEQTEANAINILASGLNAVHFDKEKQKKALLTLESNFSEYAEQIQFLLGESPLHKYDTTYGRTWNWGLLLTAGYPVVYLDDDCLLKAYKSPFEKGDGIELKKGNKSVAFLDKNYSLDEQLKPVKIDPIASLASSLGFGLSKMGLSASGFYGASHQHVNELSESTILMSSQGIAGEPGSDSLRWLYDLPQEDVRYFVETSEEKYQKNKVSRFAWTGYTQPRVSFHNSDSKVARGLDNRNLLPATLPIHRNEDALFTDLALYIYSNKAIFDHAWAIAHLPEAERKWDDQELDALIPFSLTDGLRNLMTSLSNTVGFLSLSPKDRLNIFAKQLLATTNLSEQKVTNWFYTNQQRTRARHVLLLHESLNGFPNAPDYWKKDIYRQLEANTTLEQKLLLSKDKQNQYQETLTQFAESLLVWGDLWDFAKTNDLGKA